MDKKSTKIICTNMSNGKCHDFRLFKESGVRFAKDSKAITDTGYIGLQKIHSNTNYAKKEK